MDNMLTLEWIKEHSMLLSHVLTTAFGYFIAMCVGYVKFGQEISFIKGQLKSILKSQECIKKIADKSETLEKEFIKMVVELEAIITRVSTLEKLVFQRS